MVGKQQTILTLCAHPDDAEIRCGGTLLLLAARGWRVHIATLSSGDCGSADQPAQTIAARRVAEAVTAAQCFGGTYQCLGGQDMQIFDDQTTRAAVTALLRQVQPDIVLTHYPVDYMPDHDAVSAVARAAVFTAPMPNYTSGPSAFVPATPRMAHLYYFGGPLGGVDYFGHPVKPQFAIEISAQMATKSEALACHVSQREWLRRQHGIDQYIDEMKAWDAEVGRMIGVAYAEGFHQHLGHAYPQTPRLQSLLGAVNISSAR